MARPSKYSPERAAKILEGLKAGMTLTAAWAYGGVSDQSFARWSQRNVDFVAQVAQAESLAEGRYTSVIAKAAFGHEVVERRETHKASGELEVVITTRQEYDWQAARYWLSRRRRKDWGDNIKLDFAQEVTGLLEQLVGGEHADTED